MLQKIRIASKTALNKNCSELNLNFLQKTQSAHTSISSWSGVSRPQRLLCWKFNVREWESKMLQKIRLKSKKCFKLKLLGIKFSTKKVSKRIRLSPPGVELVGSKD